VLGWILCGELLAEELGLDAHPLDQLVDLANVPLRRVELIAQLLYPLQPDGDVVRVVRRHTEVSPELKALSLA
jgi:hypothetical protein